MTGKSHDLVEFEDIGEAYVVTPSYLFESESGVVEFVIVQEDMDQLHDYCLLCIDAAHDKLKMLNRDLTDYQRGAEVAEYPELGDLTPEVIDGLVHVQIPKWEDTQSFLVKATCFVLLAALLERGLKELCESFAPPGKKVKLGAAGSGKVAAYIAFLRNDCGFEFCESPDSFRVRDDFRKVRNAFAHGDWDEARRVVGEKSLRAAFEACTELFSAIEAAYLIHTADTKP